MRNRVIELVHRHVGIRAEGMILAGMLWCLIGLRSLTGPEAAATPSVFHQTFPADLTAGLWIVTGIAAIVLAPFKHASELGLFLLVIQPGLRVASFGWAWLADLIPGPPPGDPLGWYSACVWLGVVAWVGHISRIPADVRAPLTGRRTRRRRAR